MDAAGLRAMQAPIKERYKADPKAGFITLKAKGTLDDSNIACKVETGRALAVAGLHPATGGSGMELCSGDMLLEALGRLRRRDAQSGRDRDRYSAQIRHGVGRRRSRFPRHARRRQGRAGRLRANPPALRRRHRRAAGQARSASQAHRALLRRLSDDQKWAAGRGQPQTKKPNSARRSRLPVPPRDARTEQSERAFMSPELLFWYGLALKMALTAIVVVITSVAVERSRAVHRRADRRAADRGRRGLFHSRHRTSAGSSSPRAPSAASPSTPRVSIFSLGLCGAGATPRPVAQSRRCARGLVCLCAALLHLVDWTPLTARVVLNAVVFGVTMPLSWRYRASGPPKKFLRTRFDIPLRALAAAIVVAIVTTASYSIGSFASGMFALFPIIMCSSIVILHPRVGGKATASMLAHAQIAFVGLSLGFLSPCTTWSRRSAHGGPYCWGSASASPGASCCWLVRGRIRCGGPLRLALSQAAP